MRYFDRDSYDRKSSYYERSRKYLEFLHQHDSELSPRIKLFLRLKLHDELVAKAGKVSARQIDMNIDKYIITFIDADIDVAPESLCGDVWLIDEIENVHNGRVTLGILLECSECRVQFTDVRIYDVENSKYLDAENNAKTLEHLRKSKRGKGSK